MEPLGNAASLVVKDGTQTEHGGRADAPGILVDEQGAGKLLSQRAPVGVMPRCLVGCVQHDDRAVPVDQIGFSETRRRLSERVERAMNGLRCCFPARQVSPDYRVKAKAISNLRHRS